MQVYAHPEYRAVSISYDIALLKLARPPLCVASMVLPSLDASLASGNLATVAGWGQDEDGTYGAGLAGVQVIRQHPHIL